jgi:hypothetical protein
MEFARYVGSPDFHDGLVLRVSVEGNTAEVVVEGYSGREYVVLFEGVDEVELNEPEGMLLYSLSEMRASPPLRKFVFANNDEDHAGLAEHCCEGLQRPLEIIKGSYRTAVEKSLALIEAFCAIYPSPNWPDVLDSDRGSTKGSDTAADCHIHRPPNLRNRTRAARDSALRTRMQNTV